MDGILQHRQKIAKWILIAHFRYVRYQNCHLRVLKKSPPLNHYSLMYPKIIIPSMCSALSYLVLIAVSITSRFAMQHHICSGGDGFSVTQPNVTLLYFTTLHSFSPSGSNQESQTGREPASDNGRWGRPRGQIPGAKSLLSRQFSIFVYEPSFRDNKFHFLKQHLHLLF